MLVNPQLQQTSQICLDPFVSWEKKWQFERDIFKKTTVFHAQTLILICFS